MAVDIKNKIEGIQKAKNSKREEMKKRYEELTENEENFRYVNDAIRKRD